LGVDTVRVIVTLPVLYVIGRFGLTASRVNPVVSKETVLMVTLILEQDESFNGGIVRESENACPSAYDVPTLEVL
jgi:hypothetical protein